MTAPMSDAAAAFLRAMRAEFHAVFDDWVPSGARVGLLNVADYPNVGDGAIFLGELAYLRDRGTELVQCSTVRTFDPDRLRRDLGPDGVVLLQGGGSFGDLYPAHHAFRERVARLFPDHRIVTFPVTWKFRDERAVERSRRIFGGHGGFHLATRDAPSTEAAAALGVDVRLSPDAAFALGPLERGWTPRMPIRILGRTDEEGGFDVPADLRDQAVDWLSDPPAVRALHVASRLAWLAGTPGGKLGRLADQLTLRSAQRRFAYGSKLLADGEVVVSDRLHAAIMSTLRGIPVFMVGDKYGKLRNFHDAWLKDSPTVTWNDDFPSALAAAREHLAAEGR